MAHLTKKNLILEGIIKKVSYKRRDYESVDEKSIIGYVSKKDEKRTQAVKG